MLYFPFYLNNYINKIQIEEKHPIILCDKDVTFYRYEINTLYL